METPYRALGEEPRAVLDDGAPLLGKAKPVEEGKATLSSCIANLMNTCMGTGMLALPHAFASGGLIPGILTTAFCGATAFTGLYLLSRSASKTTQRGASFSSLAAITFPSLSRLFDLAIFLKCFGVSVSYLIVVGSLMPRAVVALHPDPPEWTTERKLWIMLAMTVLTPLAFYRRLDSLKMISYIALVAVADLVFVVVFKFIEPSGIPARGPIALFDLNSKFISSLPVQIFAFTCAQNLFAVFNELRSNTQERLNIVIATSIGSATIMYQLLGVLGYLTFGALVGSNIIENYPHSILVSICQLGIVVLVLFSYPLQLHPCRASLHNLLQPKTQSGNEESGYDDDHHTAHEIPLVWFISETAFILLATFVLAIYVTKLETILGFVGATGSTTISFILPALFFISLFRNSTEPFDRRLLYVAGALLVWGVLVMITALSLNIYNLVKEPEKTSIALLGVLV